MKILKNSAYAMTLLDELSGKCSKLILSDVVTGAALLAASANGGFINVGADVYKRQLHKCCKKQQKEINMDYKHAGVDIEAGYKSVELMKEHVKKTLRPEVLTGLGGFSGAFSMERFKQMEKPTLVSGTDGVGTTVSYTHLSTEIFFMV